MPEVRVGAHRYVVSSRDVLQPRIRKQYIDIVRPHDGIANDEVLVVVFDAVMVVEIIDYDAEARRIERVLCNDPETGVMRHADAGYESAIECARANGLDLPSLAL